MERACFILYFKFTCFDFWLDYQQRIGRLTNACALGRSPTDGILSCHSSQWHMAQCRECHPQATAPRCHPFACVYRDRLRRALSAGQCQPYSTRAARMDANAVWRTPPLVCVSVRTPCLSTVLDALLLRAS